MPTLSIVEGIVALAALESVVAMIFYLELDDRRALLLVSTSYHLDQLAKKTAIQLISRPKTWVFLTISDEDSNLQQPSTETRQFQRESLSVVNVEVFTE